MQVSRSAPLTSRGVLVAWAFPEEVVEVGSVTVQHLRQGPADMCAGLECVLHLWATYLQRGRQLLRRLGEHVLERLLRVRGICEFLRRGGGAIVDIPCPRPHLGALCL